MKRQELHILIEATIAELINYYTYKTSNKKDVKATSKCFAYTFNKLYELIKSFGYNPDQLIILHINDDRIVDIKTLILSAKIDSKQF